MGYTTEFKGQIKVTPPLSATEVKYINAFSESRRMDRAAGPYFVDGSGNFGQGHDPDIHNHNSPDPSQPGLWCQWVATDDGEYIEWDDNEKFYEAGKWMKYIIDHFIGSNPIAKTQGGNEWLVEHLQGHVCNGVINAFGEEHDDIWNIIVCNNEVSIIEGKTLPLDTNVMETTKQITSKMVIVPQEKLDAIEEARKELYSMFPDMSVAMQVAMEKVTHPMWIAANTKWEEVK